MSDNIIIINSCLFVLKIFLLIIVFGWVCIFNGTNSLLVFQILIDFLKILFGWALVRIINYLVGN